MATSKQAPTPATTAAPVSVPQGYEERTSDIVGTWDPDKGPILFIPLYATVGDSKKYDKPSLLIFGKLAGDCVVNVKSEDDEDVKPTVQGKVGDLVGVWAKEGMRDIAYLCGVEVFIARDITKDRDIGKGEKMKGYRIASKEDPQRIIPIKTDRRVKSKGRRCFLDSPEYGKEDAKMASPVPISGPHGKL